MPKFTVLMSCITDMTMRVEVDAESPDEAAEKALQESADSPDWEFPDNRPEPMEGTVEAYAVDDDDDNEVAAFPQTTALEYANAGANAALLKQAVEAWPQFDTEHNEVSGADLVEWFSAWRERAKAALGSPDQVRNDADLAAPLVETGGQVG